MSKKIIGENVSLEEKLKYTASKNLTLEQKLRRAAYISDTEEITELVNAGADINAQDEYGNTALMLLVSERAYESSTSLLISNRTTAQFLLYAGADINMRNEYGETALMVASCLYKQPDTVEMLLENGADCNIQDLSGNTALMHACRNSFKDSHVSVVDILLVNGADVNVKDQWNDTALIHALGMGSSNPLIVDMLIKHGVHVQCNDGCRPLIRAINTGDSKIVAKIIACGVDVNEKYANGKQSSVLFLAVSDGNREIVKQLLDAGVDVNQVDRHGRTVFDIVQKKIQREIQRRAAYSKIADYLIEVGG